MASLRCSVGAAGAASGCGRAGAGGDGLRVFGFFCGAAGAFSSAGLAAAARGAGVARGAAAAAFAEGFAAAVRALPSALAAAGFAAALAGLREAFAGFPLVAFWSCCGAIFVPDCFDLLAMTGFPP
ncbi:hypothetical protein [Paracoccus spongiarum]|uniref:Uncharacterized protein n=1 Tax=Paracoccus spongiarum TaxID=3064387 RepID=A0ABT9J960_9RHOB|nr:hypothetical protein [Paracoccus sp. 2205BS29-5]MDP5306341.1 hypothetical protein [Paracoccus sp. 2205BS29-5]